MVPQRQAGLTDTTREGLAKITTHQLKWVPGVMDSSAWPEGAEEPGPQAIIGWMESAPAFLFFLFSKEETLWFIATASAHRQSWASREEG
jgi:hypothetical protein